MSRLGEFLRLYEADESYHWMTPGSPTIVLCQGSEVLAAGICIFPYLRCEQLWDGDVPVSSPDLLAAWFQEVGVELPQGGAAT